MVAVFLTGWVTVSIGCIMVSTVLQTGLFKCICRLQSSSLVYALMVILTISLTECQLSVKMRVLGHYIKYALTCGKGPLPISWKGTCNQGLDNLTQWFSTWGPRKVFCTIDFNIIILFPPLTPNRAQDLKQFMASFFIFCCLLQPSWFSLQFTSPCVFKPSIYFSVWASGILSMGFLNVCPIQHKCSFLTS